MIPSPTSEPTTEPAFPNFTDLGIDGQLYLLAWAQMRVLCDLPATVEKWRAAWGEAADYQTVVDARRVLAKGLLLYVGETESEPRPWRLSTGGRPLWGGFDIRPLVVIDPEDREAVERLAIAHDAALREADPDYYERAELYGSEGDDVDVIQAALREFASPTPPKPEEPQGLGAVVEDAEGYRWVRVEELPPFGPWYCGVLPEDECSIADGAFREWSDIAAVRILSPGVES